MGKDNVDMDTSKVDNGEGQRSGGMGGDGVVKSIGEVKLENLGYNSDRGDYYSTVANITHFQKDKALYKACPNMVDGRECNKKVQDNGDSTFRCEKCSLNLNNFKWRLMVSLNMGDYSDGMWATCFQETAEKLLGMSSEEVGNMSEQDEEGYNKVFTDACFETYSFRCRAKADTYNDETRVKHTVISDTVISVEPIEYNAMNKMLIKEIESMGGSVPDTVDRSKYIAVASKRCQNSKKKGEMSYDDKLKFVSVVATPMASRKFSKKIYKLIKKSSKQKDQLRSGLKDVQRRIRKGESGIVVFAGDVTPVDVMVHMPGVCESKQIPYVYTPSRTDLGAAMGVKRGCLMMLVRKHDDYQDLYDEVTKEISTLN